MKYQPSLIMKIALLVCTVSLLLGAAAKLAIAFSMIGIFLLARFL